MIEIEYRDASYFEGTYGRKKVHRIEATFGQIRAFGRNKSEAKAELERLIHDQCSHLYERSYLMGIAWDGNPVAFAMYYNQGWCYDIVRLTEGVHKDLQRFSRVSTTQYNQETEFVEAWGKMNNHFDQYTERAA